MYSKIYINTFNVSLHFSSYVQEEHDISTEIDNRHLKLNMPSTSSRSPSLNLFRAESSTSQLRAMILDQRLRIISLTPYTIESTSPSHQLCVLNAIEESTTYHHFHSSDRSLWHCPLLAGIVQEAPYWSPCLYSCPTSADFQISLQNNSFIRFLLCPKPFLVLHDFDINWSLLLGVCFTGVFQALPQIHLLGGPTLTTPGYCEPSYTLYPLPGFIFLPSICHYINATYFSYLFCLSSLFLQIDELH